MSPDPKPPVRPVDPRRPAVILLVDDLFFRARLEDAVRQAGGQPVMTENTEGFLRAMDTTLPVLALVDLHIAAQWDEAFRLCRLRPHTRAVPLYGFGRHTDVDTLTRARAAGADQAWARSRLVQELPALLTSRIDPPRPMPAGGEEALPPLAQQGIALFNRRQFHAQHEAFEDAWNQETRTVRELYQGLLQVGLAFLQLEARNPAGAYKMFGRGIPRLRPLPSVVQGVCVGRFVDESLAVFARLADLRVEEDWRHLVQALPRIHIAEPA